MPATIEIKENIDESPAVVFCDSSSINQIMMNLIINASHSMENDTGIIKIKFTSEILEGKDLNENKSLSPGTFLKLTIQDNGIGIDPSIINHIFDPFFTTKEVGKGTGMGLSVVHGIIKSHGGMIKVKRSWWEIIALVLLDMGKSKVPDIFKHELLHLKRLFQIRQL